MALSATFFPVEAADEPGRENLDKLLRGIEENDYSTFIADGTPLFKKSLTKAAFQSVSNQVAPRLKKGYTTSYLEELKQQGCRVLLYKLSYSDGGDDTLAKLVLQDGKVAGFWLQ